MDATVVDQWLQRIDNWTSTPSVSASDLDQLREFLDQLHGWLRECGRHEVASSILPRIEQLLRCLCCIRAVKLQGQVYQQVLRCILELCTNQPSKALEERSRVLRSVTTNQVPHPCQGIATTLSCSVHRYNQRASLKLLESMVKDLEALPRTRWDAGNNCLVPCPQLSDATLSNLSELCLLLVTSGDPAVAPLVESLLGRHGNGTQDGLSLHFLQAVMATQDNAYTDRQCILELSYKGLVCLWCRHLPALQNEFLHLIDAISHGEIHPSMPDCKQLMTRRGLPRACAENPALLSAVEELMQSLLQASEGSRQAVALLQQFASCVRESQSCLTLPVNAGQEIASLQTKLLPDPQELSLESVSLHVNSISSCLSNMAATAPTRLAHAWLLLMEFEVWYPVVIRLLLLGNLEDVPACLNVVAFYIMPIATSKHEHFKSELSDVVNSLRSLCSASSPTPHDLNQVLGGLLAQGYQDGRLLGLVKPLLMLLAVNGKATHQILPDIVRLACGGNQPNAMDTLAFLLDSLEFSLSDSTPTAFRQKTQEAIGNRGKRLVNTLRMCRANCAKYQEQRPAGTVDSMNDNSWGRLLDRCDRVLRLVLPT